MGAFAITDGAPFMVQPAFGNRLVIVPPQPITGLGMAQICGRRVAVLGNEKQALLGTFLYNAAPYMAGQVKLVVNLEPDQIAQVAPQVSSMGTVVLKGQKYQVISTVVQPAINPGSGDPDPVLGPMPGMGEFLPVQFCVTVG
ncbi:hypothetical protein [Paraburkholderia aspalathi]|uniref:hypothetical protein n=1 Tax=Paraburkholderia aspalathi TaxID=1324617 RepID=UPI0038BC4285